MKPDPELDVLLESIDEDQLAKGLPILSVIVLPEPGDRAHMIPATRSIVDRYGLQRPGESEAECLARLREEARCYASAAGSG